MNRKQKLIVSITGITIVMLALLGLTYGYYLTRIQGNTNSNSISITTSDLKLTYRDGMGELTAQNIMPGNEVSSKTFTVENEGEQDVSVYTVALINIMNNFTFKDDLEVSVSCFSNINSGVCEGFAEDYENKVYKEKYPATNSELFSLGIKEGETHTFTLKVNYLYQDFDQSDDMGKTLKAKVQIYDPKDTIEVSGEVTGYTEGDYAEIHSDVQTSEIVDGVYKFVGIPADNHTIYIKNRNTNAEKSTTLEIKKGTTESTTNGVITFTDTSKIANVTIDTTNPNLSTTINKVSDGGILLADAVISNAKRNINGRTVYTSNLSVNPIQTSSSSNEMILSETLDNYGTSYYFRGNVIDNYVTFNNMCWKIIRVQGDGSIKIIFADASSPCSISTTSNMSNSDNVLLTSNTLGINRINLGPCDVAASAGTCIGDMYYSKFVYSSNESTAARNVLKNWLDNKFSMEIKKKLKSESWFYDNTDICYDSKGTSITCSKYNYSTSWKKINIDNNISLSYSNDYYLYDVSNIGMITIDELYLSGNSSSSYLSFSNVLWVTLSVNNIHTCSYGCAAGGADFRDSVYSVDNGVVFDNVGSGSAVHLESKLRPVIVLNADVKISSGEGTLSNPYIVE